MELNELLIADDEELDEEPDNDETDELEFPNNLLCSSLGSNMPHESIIPAVIIKTIIKTDLFIRIPPLIVMRYK